MPLNGKEFFNGDLNLALDNLPANSIEKIQVFNDRDRNQIFSGAASEEHSKVINIVLKKSFGSGFLFNFIVGCGQKSRNGGDISVIRIGNRLQASFHVVVSRNLSNLTSGYFYDETSSPATFNSLSLSLDMGFQIKKRNTGRFTYTLYKINSTDHTTTSANNIFESRSINTVDSGNSKSSNFNHKLSFKIEGSRSAHRYVQMTVDLSATQNLTISQTNETFFENQTRLLDYISKASFTAITPFISLSGYKCFDKDWSLNYEISSSINRSKQIVQTSSSSSGLFDSVSPPVLSNYYINSPGGSFLQRCNISILRSLSVGHVLEAKLSESSGNERRLISHNKFGNVEPLSLVNLSGIESFQQPLVQNFSLSYRYYNRKYGITTRLKIQRSFERFTSSPPRLSKVLEKISIFPEVSGFVGLGHYWRASVNFDQSLSMPSSNQVLAFTDKTDPTRQIVGNPNLEPEKTSRFALGVTKINVERASSFLLNLTVSVKRNSIVPAKTSLHDTITTTYINSPSSFSYGVQPLFVRPVFKRLVLSISGAANVNSNFVRFDQLEGKSTSWLLTSNSKVRYKFFKESSMDIFLNTQSSLIFNSIAQLPSRKDNFFKFGLDLKVNILQGLSSAIRVSKTVTPALGTFGSTNFTILNFFLEKRFRAIRTIFRLEGTNMLNINSYTSRSLGANSSSEFQRTSPGRCVIATIKWSLSKFEHTAF